MAHRSPAALGGSAEVIALVRRLRAKRSAERIAVERKQRLRLQLPPFKLEE